MLCLFPTDRDKEAGLAVAGGVAPKYFDDGLDFMLSHTYFARKTIREDTVSHTQITMAEMKKS